MYGGQFGGAGASGSWNRNRSRRAWTRGRGGLYTRRRRAFGYKGATFHHVGLLTVSSGSTGDNRTEQTASLLVSPFMGFHNFYDVQPSLIPQGSMPEMAQMAVRVRPAKLTVDVWPLTEAVDGVLLYVPWFIAIGLITFRPDDSFEQSSAEYNDASLALPTHIPNMFLRDYGRVDYYSSEVGIVAGSTAARHPLQEPVRILYRDFFFLPQGDANFEFSQDSRYRVKFKTPAFTIKQNQSLCFIAGAYSSLSGEGEVILTYGWGVSGTAGYRIFKREV